MFCTPFNSGQERHILLARPKRSGGGYWNEVEFFILILKHKLIPLF